MSRLARTAHLACVKLAAGTWHVAPLNATCCLPALGLPVPRRKVTHPEFGTEMRMLLQEVPVRIAVEGDKTWSGLLGPLHDP